MTRQAGPLDLPVCTLGSNSSGRDHGFVAESPGCRLSGVERSRLDQYSLTVFATFLREQDQALPLDFMAFIPLTTDAASRWALIDTRVEGRSSTGILVDSRAAILSSDQARLGFDSLARIHDGLQRGRSESSRTQPLALQVLLTGAPYAIPTNILRICAKRAGKPIRVFLLSGAPATTAVALMICDASVILNSTMPMLCTAPVPIVSQDWSLITPLTLKRDTEAHGQPPKGYIAVDKDLNIPDLGLTPDMLAWCEICESVAHTRLRQNLIVETQEVATFDVRVAELIWNISGYAPGQVARALSRLCTTRSDLADFVQTAISRVFSWIANTGQRSAFQSVFGPLIKDGMVDPIRAPNNRLFEGLVIDTLLPSLASGQLTDDQELEVWQLAVEHVVGEETGAGTASGNEWSSR